MKELFLKISAMSVASFIGSYVGTQKWFDKHEKGDN
tara:strand:+ start:229 stop:336 length:108 start_codon:yes stop_codon:yes gene_type:complete